MGHGFWLHGSQNSNMLHRPQVKAYEPLTRCCSEGPICLCTYFCYKCECVMFVLETQLRACSRDVQCTRSWVTSHVSQFFNKWPLTIFGDPLSALIRWRLTKTVDGNRLRRWPLHRRTNDVNNWRGWMQISQYWKASARQNCWQRNNHWERHCWYRWHKKTRDL